MYKSFRLVHDKENNDSLFSFEKNFPIEMTVSKLKERLEVIVGIPKDNIDVDLCNLDGSLIAHFDDANKLISDYYDFSGTKQMLLKIISDGKCVLDEFSCSKYNNIIENDIESRFKLTDEEYNQRDDTLRKFKQLNNINNVPNVNQSSDIETIVKRFYIGQRCVIKSPGKPDRVATIRYIGIPDKSECYRIGVEFDHYLGLHDGNFNGEYYFRCEPKKGSYILPEFVFPIESDEKNSNQENQEDLEEF